MDGSRISCNPSFQQTLLVSRTTRVQQKLKTIACLAAVGLLLSPAAVHGESAEIAPLAGHEAGLLGVVTGLHSVRHKKSGLEARLLEADGSGSVAHDPIALFLVVTNNGTSDLKEHVWRLPRGVARVRGLSETACGVDASVEVDRPGNPTPKEPSRSPFLVSSTCASSRRMGSSSRSWNSATVR